MTTPDQSHVRQRHARIMVEGGCSIEDVAITFKWTIERTLMEVAPALKCNPEARAFARRHHGQVLAKERTPAIHRGFEGASRSMLADEEPKRNAA